MSNGTLVKAAIVALGCSFALVGCGTYNHQASFDQNQAKVASAESKADVKAENVAVNKAFDKQKDLNKKDIKNKKDKQEQQASNKQDKNEQKIVSSTYHFKHDSAALNENAKSELDQFAQYLSKNPSAKINVEGYTDEKGKADYNLALGMRRAEAIASYLKEQGVKESQIKMKSYGEKKPADVKASGDAFAHNRRAVVYFETEEGVA